MFVHSVWGGLLAAQSHLTCSACQREFADTKFFRTFSDPTAQHASLASPGMFETLKLMKNVWSYVFGGNPLPSTETWEVVVVPEISAIMAVFGEFRCALKGSGWRWKRLVWNCDRRRPGPKMHFEAPHWRCEPSRNFPTCEMRMTKKMMTLGKGKGNWWKIEISVIEWQA